MRKEMVLFAAMLLVICSIFNSCYYDNEEDLLSGQICDTVAVSFAEDIVPILQSSCYICHSIENGESAGDGYILETYDELTAATDGPTLIDAVDWIDGGTANMPKGGSQLPKCSRSLIRNWVAQGMLNN